MKFLRRYIWYPSSEQLWPKITEAQFEHNGSRILYIFQYPPVARKLLDHASLKRHNMFHSSVCIICSHCFLLSKGYFRTVVTPFARIQYRVVISWLLVIVSKMKSPHGSASDKGHKTRNLIYDCPWWNKTTMNSLTTFRKSRTTVESWILRRRFYHRLRKVVCIDARWEHIAISSIWPNNNIFG